MLDPEIDLLVFHGGIEDVVDLRDRGRDIARVGIGVVDGACDRRKCKPPCSERCCEHCGGSTCSCWGFRRCSGSSEMLPPPPEIPILQETLQRRRSETATRWNHREIHARGILHIDVHSATVKVVADVVHQKEIIALLCIVDQQIGVVWARYKRS